MVVWLWFLRIYLTYFICWRTVIYTTWFFSFVLCEGMWKYVWLSWKSRWKTRSLDLYRVCRIAKSLFSPYRNRIMQEIVIKVANLVITLQEKESTVLHAFFFYFSFCPHIKKEKKKRYYFNLQDFVVECLVHTFQRWSNKEMQHRTRYDSTIKDVK